MSLPPDPLPDSLTVPGRAKRTRNRVPASCSVCRKKKIKCDKSKPFCGSCIRSSTCSSCQYESQNWDSSAPMKKLTKQLIQLKQENAELKSLLADYEAQLSGMLEHKANPQDLATIDRYNANVLKRSTGDYTPLISNQRKFKNQEDEDEILDLVKDFDVLVIKENKLIHFGSTSFMSLASNDPVLREAFGKFLSCQKEAYSKAHRFFGETDYDNSEATLLSATINKSMSAIIDPINEILPPRHIFDALLETFFEKCYIMMPFVDKQIFLNQVNYISRTTESGETYFIIPSRSHLIVVAIVLIFLRFAYLTLPIEQIKRDSKAKNYGDLTRELFGRSIEISPIFIEHAKNCITNSSALRKANLQIVQAFLYLKFYKLQSPEDGDSGIDASISLSIIVQMARVIGLNRDPNNFEIVDDARIKHVWRKVWYKLVELDSLNSIYFGCPLLIPDDDYYDTELPYIGIDLQRSGNLSIYESEIVKIESLNYKAVSLFRKVTKVFNVIKGDPKKSEINKSLEELEDFIQNDLRKLEEFEEFSNLAHSDSRVSFKRRAEMTKECIITLNTLSTYHILNYLLFLSTGADNVANNPYTAKCIGSGISLFKFCFDYFKHPDNYFGSDLSKFVIPKFLSTSIRVCQILCIIIMRLFKEITKASIQCPEFFTKELFDWLTADKKLISKLTGVNENDDMVMSLQLYAYLEEFYRALVKISPLHFQAWKLCKTLAVFTVYLIEKRPIYKDFSNKLHAEKVVDKRSKQVVRETTVESHTKQKADNDKSFNNSIKDLEFDTDPVHQYELYIQRCIKELSSFDVEEFALKSWDNYVDEIGQNKFDYFNPILDLEDQINNDEDDNLTYEDKNLNTNKNDAANNNSKGENDQIIPVTLDKFDFNDINLDLSQFNQDSFLNFGELFSNGQSFDDDSNRVNIVSNSSTLENFVKPIKTNANSSRSQSGGRGTSISNSSSDLTPSTIPEIDDAIINNIIGESVENISPNNEKAADNSSNDNNIYGMGIAKMMFGRN